ncbi:MAG TPA: serine/threonine-protein kinase [Kofleriaceae bacterium]|nr:serine/threonine-protein kinase [Kofleriaceae bacterium]
MELDQASATEISTELRSIIEALAHAPEWPIEAPLEVAPGDRIGRYALERVIGSGGFGVVFAARDEALGRRVAIKLSRGAATPDVLERIEREGRIAAQLNHPNLVTLYDSGAAFGLPFLVLELLDGETLAARLARGPIEPPRALEIVAEVARALVPVHAANIVHLDLKPSNVFVTTDGRIKVLDFGLARLRDVSDGRRAGTPGFMAPEQERGEDVDARADVFALGVMLDRMIASDAPVPAGIRAIVERATATSAEARFPDAAALLAALDGLRERARRARRLFWIVTVVAIAIAVVAVAQVRSHRAALAAARAAERAGQEASAIVAELREARLQPLHDIRPDEARARERLQTLATEIGGGDVAEIALARAERALRELPRARARLEAVLARERSSTAVAEHGEVLLDEYEQRVHDASFDVDVEHREHVLAELDATLRVPALRELDEAGATTQLTLARVALYQRRYIDARELAGEALAARPGGYEAAVLLGDVDRSEADVAEKRGDDRGVLDATARADGEYQLAAAIARSDPAVYARDCWALAAAMRAHDRRGDDAAPAYAAAAAACVRGLVALPDDPDDVVDAAMLRSQRARELSQLDGPAAAPLALVAEARDLIGHARAAHPDDAELARVDGMTLTARANIEAYSRDPRPTFTAAIRAYIDAWRLRPTGEALDEIGTVEALIAEYEGEHGIDPRDALDRATLLLRHREATDVAVAVGRALNARGNWLSTHGADPRPLLDRAVAEFEQVRARQPNEANAADEEANSWTIRAQWESRNSIAPIPSLDRAITCSEAVLGINPNALGGRSNLGDELMARAWAERDRGGDGLVFLRRAQEQDELASKISPGIAVPLDNLGYVHSLAATWLVAKGEDPTAEIAAAHRALDAGQVLEHDELFALPIDCELDAAVARWEAHEHRSPAAAVARAKAECARAVALDPGNAVIKGRETDVVTALSAL